MKSVIEFNRDVEGFVSASGKKIINGRGCEILLRGVGLGSWFLPEGYMWCFPDQGDRPRRIEKMILELLGPEKAGEFWRTYFDSFISEEDIRRIREEGFNSIRLPLSYRYLQRGSESLERVDKLIEWCREHRLYVILDLHGAPGGQTGTNIDDSEKDQPELFMDESHARETVRLWRELALRYRDEWIVAGYDLLNEPLPEWFSDYNDKVMPLYRDIIRAIREVDTKHMIILEGVHWATDWSIFTERLDDNLMLQFHKYWNSPDRESLEPYLEKRGELDVPIFMGEGGENNCDWYSGAFQLFEDLDISWNFWTWKKMERDNSPCSIVKPENWDCLVTYLEVGEKPDRELAETVLWDFLSSLPIDKCLYRRSVAWSLLRRPPVRIPAVFYSNCGPAKAYSIHKNLRQQAIGFRDSEAVPIGFTSGKRNSVAFNHSGGEPWGEDDWMYIRLDEKDWILYDFLADSPMEMNDFEFVLKIRGVEETASIKLSIESSLLEAVCTASDDWTEVKVPLVFRLERGRCKIKLTACDNPVQIERISIIPVKGE